MAKTELHWKAPDFEYRQKNISWYWSSVFIAVVLLALALWQKNFLFAVFIVLGEIMLVVWANKLPRFFGFSIDERGISIEKKFYPYSEIEHFSILEQNNDFNEIILKSKKGLSPYISLRIKRDLLPKAKAILLEYLPEEEYEETLPDAFSRFIKF